MYDRMFSRLVVANAEDIAATRARIESVWSLPQILEVDAIAVFPGQLEWDRVIAAIQAYNDNPHIRYLLVAGYTHTERGYTQLTLAKLKELGLKREDGVVIKFHAWHTKQQAFWLTLMIRELGITSLALCASVYHIPRAYLTVLRTFQRRDMVAIPMVPLCPTLDMETISPLNGVTFRGMLPGEMRRIRGYTQDVATDSELDCYLERIRREFTPLARMVAQPC